MQNRLYITKTYVILPPNSLLWIIFIVTPILLDSLLIQLLDRIPSRQHLSHHKTQNILSIPYHSEFGAVLSVFSGVFEILLLVCEGRHKSQSARPSVLFSSLSKVRCNPLLVLLISLQLRRSWPPSSSAVCQGGDSTASISPD